VPAPTPDEAFVFNIVWTGSVFTYLRFFVASQIAQSRARFRFLGNGCPPEQLRMMERFAARFPGRVVEVLETSAEMVNHGAALDTARTQRDDGDYFCFIDPDILARGPFLGRFAEALAGGCAAVTSGRGVWIDDDRVPPGHPGVSGEYFYAQDGFLFGSPHFAMYRRAPLEATIERWGVTFVSAGNDLSDAAKEQLRVDGHDYFIFDTAKLVNIFLQVDGNRFCHFEHPQLMHIGGVSHYLAPTGYQKPSDDADGTGGETEPNWETWRGMETRFEVARYTARVLRDLSDGGPAPAIPDGLDPSVAEKLVPVRAALIDLVDRYRDDVGPA
jgi:hypothetical protein